MAAPYGKPPAPYGAPQGYPGGPPGAYGAPPPGAPGGYPPPGQYGAPPPGAPGGYLPPGQYGAPPPGQYGAPPPGQYGAPPPGQYGAKPPAGAPPGPYGAPPPGQYGAPPPGQYGAPPPGQYGAPPPGQYGAPPPGQYGAPPGGAPYGAPPPGQYGAPPPGQYGAPPGQYGAKPPAAPYGAPPGQYGAPPPGQYGAPPGQYGAPPGQYGAPAPGHYGAPGQYGAAPGQPQAWGAKPPAGGAGGWNVAADPRKNAFMSALKQNLTRDYVILVDKSGSMQGQRWHDANVALQALAGEVCRADPDGATLVFFSTAGTLLRYGNVTSGGKVNELFSTVYPGGTTDLGGALTAVLNEHFDPSRAKPGYPPGHAPTTVLIITDGEPDDAGEVVRVLVNASNALLADAELSVTFIQVGDDEDAARFLRTLDDGLVPKGARFDIVDTITKDKMMGLSFADLIFKSLHD